MFFSHKLVELILEISRMDHILYRAIFGIKTQSLFANIFWKLKHDDNAGISRGEVEAVVVWKPLPSMMISLLQMLVGGRYIHYTKTTGLRVDDRVYICREFLVMRERDNSVRALCMYLNEFEKPTRKMLLYILFQIFVWFKTQEHWSLNVRVFKVQPMHVYCNQNLRMMKC